MTKKELLTFSQLSNLEWQFYQYKKEINQNNKLIIFGNNITKEMFKTENFIKEISKDEFKPAYKETGIDGLALMRRKCGIALELMGESK